MTVTLSQAIECAQRELRIRRKVYPSWVRKQQMSQATADYEIAAMEGVIHYLEKWRQPQLVDRESVGER